MRGNGLVMIQSVTDTKFVTSETFDSRNGEASVSGVTDVKSDAGDTFDNRNADPLDNAAAEIGALARFAMTEGERKGRELAYKAQRACDSCGWCGRDFNKNETVWRLAIRLGPGFFGGISWTVTPVCEQCRPRELYYCPEKPCEHCGRAVINVANGMSWRREHTFCSEQCAKEHGSIVQKSVRAQRRQQREYVCRVCEKPFKPSSRDALHCSSACRQRDYRKRKQEGTEKEARTGQ